MKSVVKIVFVDFKQFEVWAGSHGWLELDEETYSDDTGIVKHYITRYMTPGGTISARYHDDEGKIW